MTFQTKNYNYRKQIIFNDQNIKENRHENIRQVIKDSNFVGANYYGKGKPEFEKEVTNNFCYSTSQKFLLSAPACIEVA
jgi:hypothetical protein